MKSKLLLFFLVFVCTTVSFAQNGVRIAATTGTADASAMLDVVSTTKGFLTPRMTAAQRAAIASPATGLIVYQTDGAQGLYYYTGPTGSPANTWVQLSAGALSGAGTTNYVAKWTSASAIGNSQISDNGTNVGINSASPTQKLDIQGGTIRVSGLTTASGVRPVYSNTSGVLVNNTTIQLIDPLYIRGTGLNNSGNRVLRIGNTEIYNTTGGRGLRLTIITKATHAVVSTTDYDTYGDAAASNNLATALNNMTNAQIGILTSYDAWEGQITTNLQTAFARLGLYKALMTTVGGARRPYAAIFQGATGSAIPTATAAEVEHSTAATTDYAEIRGYLIDGSFIATTQVPSGLSTPVGSYAVGVNESGNVGIGTTNPTDKLFVEGNVLSKGVKNVSGTVSTYDISTRRYYIRGTYGADGGRTIPLDMNIVHDLCGDEDGCRIRFNMRYWSGTEIEAASDGNGHPSSYLFSYDLPSGRWRLGGTSGVDGNGSVQHIISIYSGACYFTDGEYSAWTNNGDGATKQLGLLIWNGAYNVTQRTCELTLED